jgi:hypothetical protein
VARVKVNIAGSAEEHVDIDRKPDVCPLCHHAVDPRQHPVCVASGPTSAKGTVLEAVYQCTRRKCLRLFVGRYRRTTSQGDNLVGPFKLQEVAPQEFSPPAVSAEVEEVSPSFKAIFCQAAAAESCRLSEIAGLGYRKALEFLVKDFCIHNVPDEAENIKKETLGNTIASRIEDPNVKECARRAAWLGNDEAHYVRRWEDRDINDLKILIELTSNWIRNCILTERYLREMENR